MIIELPRTELPQVPSEMGRLSPEAQRRIHGIVNETMSWYERELRWRKAAERELRRRLPSLRLATALLFLCTLFTVLFLVIHLFAGKDTCREGNLFAIVALVVAVLHACFLFLLGAFLL